MTDFAERKAENSRLLREDIEAQRVVLRGLPEVIAFHTTEKCNLRCVMCPRSLGQGKLQLPRERLATICDDLFPTAQKAALSAAAGEPLLADFDLVLDKALTYGVRLDVVTNGTQLDLETYRTARRALDHINVSVDCHVPAVHEAIRVGAKFDKLDANLRAIADERGREPDDVLLSISAVVMRSTLPHLEDLARYARDLGTNGLILQQLSHGVKKTPEEQPDPDEVRTVLEATRRVAEEIGLNLFVSDFGLPNLFAGPIREKIPAQVQSERACWYVVQHLGVQPTGEVYPCAMPTTFKLGDLNHESPADIWNSPAAQSLRAAHYTRRGNLFCSGCVHAPHLPARRPAFVVDWLRRRRMKQADRKHRRERDASTTE